jgi:ParB family chromosome partitioning protein
MKHTKELLSVALSSLVPSPYNVRRHTAGQIEELAALIDAQGLLHNLVVTEQVAGRGKASEERFAVAAGERRRRAMLLLQQRGRLPKTHEVLCELVPPERAREVSIAENSGREALHPADEFDAFKALIGEGKGIEDVAARFGVSVLTVQRRLKLSALSPKLLSLYRQAGINLDQLMALALSDDHEAQERAWFEAQPWDREPSSIRRKLTTGEVEAATSALARFVGVEAYEAAGGVVRRDPFDDDQSRFLSDPALLDRLATEKLEAVAAAIREDAAESWKWVEARLTLDHCGLRQFAPCEHKQRRPNAEESASLAELAERDKELGAEEERLSDSDDVTVDDWERINLEQQDIEARRKGIEVGLRVGTEADRRGAGVIVTINRTGELEILRGLMSEAIRKAKAERSAPASGNEAARSEAHVPAHPVGEGERSGTSNLLKGRHATMSKSLSRRLAAHRSMALQATLLQRTPVALALLADVFVQRAFGESHYRSGSVAQITPQFAAGALKAAADDLESSAAWGVVEDAKQVWAERIAAAGSARLVWLIELPQTDLLELLALCTALTVNVLPGASSAFDTNVLASAVDLDMAAWWEPTPARYLNHVPKSQVIVILEEAGSGLTDGGVEAMKKEALVACASARLAGRRWLPLPLRKPSV